MIKFDSKILAEDLMSIKDKVRCVNKLEGSSILLTGCAGFLGFNFLFFLTRFSNDFGIKKIYGLDSFLFGKPDWLIKLEQKYPTVLEVHKFDIAKDELECLSSVEDVKYVIHMASVASPSFYRKYPLETIDGNISGLRRLRIFEKSTF